ncbi:hypothetical protein BLA29_005189 [Euroglyphus maynei]|uniref:NADP-dependent oxidoreductase domain-containing protein n=1 Tax=Euroglyphus maynei TaxID=6958 RepID=A0A1Y3B3F3_EURMA|nr:hypothetical protein BLA29_005189 [Euroglyphus maynei]
MEMQMYNGNKIPIIGVGTYLMKDENELFQIIDESLRIGYRLIDTAAVYRNESIIGKIISSCNLNRKDIFITTKLSPADQGRGKCKKAIMDSLERLKLSYIDLVLIHFPGSSRSTPKSPKNPENRRGSWEDLEELQQSGIVKNIGVSNYTVRHLQELFGYAKIKPVVNQIEVHPLYHPKELIDFCKKHSIIVQAYSSLGARDGWPILSTNSTLNEIAKKYEKTVAQILLKWALQHDLCIIPKTSNVERLKSNFQIFDFKLSIEDMDKIDGLNENLWGAHYGHGKYLEFNLMKAYCQEALV